ncbi:putative ribonuclease H protein [Vitis vinifera]|uniref:Putative ribonuclease H protein n=2 Tax=Vitis vinifera TaxID=29760 RepID=A0A438BXJ5_VITVI|nr:putative ribonuclease H protein [Vitis vinifera]
MGGGMEAHKNKFIEEWGAARENLEYNFRWTRRNLVLAGIFGVAVPILVYRGIVKEFVILSHSHYKSLFQYSVLLSNIDAIEQEGALSSDLAALRAIRKGELEELILREEIHWKQKAKIKWVKEGDCNSKLFHKVANGSRNKNFIKILENERGLVLDSSESITEEILLYFKKLYSCPPWESWRVEDRDKAPGPDGFTIAVFQDCWDVIKEDLVRVFAEFHNSGIINQNTNASFIVLLPKKSQSKKISDFRPISLITCLYKIIAKVLSGRLRGVLQETIHSTQGAFVQGRQILDAVLIANEIVDEKKRSGEEGVVFKIDFEKAYDHVNWDFLDHVLEMKGFSPRWRSWMRGCLSSVSYAILVNGNAKGWVKAARGLRQGDPLSPFLFTIVADVLSRMLLKAEERNLLEGFRVGRNRCRVSHLQFADDTILFASPREDEVQTLKSLLLVFGQISGLKASDWPILYLGLPLGGNPTACGFWDPVIERISKRLDGWQKAYLSFGGRITLLHSCLSHIPSYFLSLFKIPASVAAKIERLQRDFLWSGVGEGKRDHLVRWEAVSKPRSIGGLGIGKIPLRNRALLGKWLWRFPRESTSLWHQVILSLYGTHSNGWDANTIVRWSHRCPWKAIAQGFQDFSKYTRFIVGDGERIRFWEDLWWGDQILKDQYPRLFRVVMDKNIPISSILGSSRPFSWNFNFRRNLTVSEIEDLERLMHSLDYMNLSTFASDARSWSLCSSGLFTVKSFFTALSQMPDSSPFFPTKFVWKSQVPFKVKAFIWLVAHKKVNTNDLLQLRRPYKAISPNICKLCMEQGESADHLFLHCSVTLGLWHRLFQLAKMDWVPPKSISDMMFINYKGFGKSKRGVILWQNASIALIWVVWRERNARIFEDKTRNAGNLWDSIHFLASLWAFCSAGFKGIPLNLLQLDWLSVCCSNSSIGKD